MSIVARRRITATSASAWSRAFAARASKSYGQTHRRGHTHQLRPSDPERSSASARAFAVVWASAFIAGYAVGLTCTVQLGSHHRLCALQGLASARARVDSAQRTSGHREDAKLRINASYEFQHMRGVGRALRALLTRGKADLMRASLGTGCEPRSQAGSAPLRAKHLEG